YEIIATDIRIKYTERVPVSDNPWHKDLEDFNSLLPEGMSFVGYLETLNSTVGTYTRVPNHIQVVDFDIVDSLGNSVKDNFNISYSLAIYITNPLIEHEVKDATLVDGVWEISVPYDKELHYAIVEPAIEGATVNYVVQGIKTKQPASYRNVVDTEITYSITAPNYETTTGTIHFVISKVQLELEFLDVEVDENGNPTGRVFDGYNTRFDYEITPFAVPSTIHFYRNDIEVFSAMSVGVYTVEIVVADSLNYYGFVRTFEYEILRSERPLAILADYIKQPYTGSPVENPAVVSPLPITEENATFTYYDAEGNLLLDRPVNVGKYTVVISVDENEYYVATTKSFEFEILESALIVFWENVENYYYDGLQHEPTAYTIDLDNNIIPLELSYEDGILPILAGKYVATAVLPEGYKNYKVVNNTCEFTIFARNLDVIIYNDYILVGEDDFVEEIAEANNLAEGDQFYLQYRLPAYKRVRGSIYNDASDIFVDEVSIISALGDVTDSYNIRISVHLEVYLPRIEYEFIDAELVGSEYVYHKVYDGELISPVLNVITEPGEGEQLVKEFDETQAFVDAGTYTLPYRIMIGYYEEDGRFVPTHEPVIGTVRVVIDRAEYTIVVEEELSKPYDKVQVFPVVSVNGILRSDALFNFPCYIEFYQDGETLMSNPVNAGTYTIEITVYTSGNYKTTKYTEEFEITKAESNITVNNYGITVGEKYDFSKVYDGQPVTHALKGEDSSAKIQYEVVGDGKVQVRYYDANKKPISNPVNAGLYYIQFEVSETVSYKAFTSPMYSINIIKAYIFVGNFDVHEQKYFDGTKFELDASIFTILKQEYIKQQLGDTGFENIVGASLVEDSASRFTISGKIYTASEHPGQYGFGPDFDVNYVIITDIETGEDVSGNYEIYAFCDVLIKPEQVGVTCKDVVVDYDGEAHTIDPRPEKNITNYTVQYSKDGELYQYTPITYTDCGTYTIFYKILFEDYDEVDGSATLTINKVAAARIDIIQSLSGVYTGFAVHEPLYSSNTLGDVTCTWYMLVDGEYQEVESAIHVGSYKVKVSMAEGKNFFAGEAEATFEITPKKVSIGWVNTELTYTGTAQQPIPYFVGGIADKLAIEVTTDRESIARGTYTAFANVTEGYGDYIIDPESAQTTFTISHKLVDVLAVMEREFTGRDIMINVNAFYEASIKTVRNVGTYEIQVSLLDKENYKWRVISENGDVEVTDSGDMTITMTVTEANINNADFGTIADQPYTGKAITPKVSVSYNGIILVDGIDYVLEYENNINIGKNAIARVVACSDGNFASFHDVFFTIEKTTLDFVEGSTYAFVNATSATTFEPDEHEIYTASKRIIVDNVAAKTTIADFLSNFKLKENQSFVVINANGATVRDTQYKTTYIGTKFRLQLKEGNYIKDSVYVS
ncbi:MAG: hypothetical protein K2K50_04565, partial [Anaeroplasmataceae bacterium]|nr:hypothetical protein [Anaeroplasmataceae bacterium]